MAAVQRALYAYSIHGRGREGVIDYTAFMRGLAAAPIARRQATVRDETVAITRVEEQGGGLWLLRFVAGSEGGPPLTFFNTTTGQESEAQGPRGSIPVRPTLVFINPGRQLVVTERRRPGLTASDIARALSAVGQTLDFARDLIIDLNPVASESFLEELDELARIRKAAVVVARPNFDWTDNATRLTEYAAESNGQTAEVEISAPRGGSLSTNQGIVADIKNLVSHAIAPLKRVRVVGNHPDETKERTLTLTQHQERQYAELDTNQSIPDQEVAMASAASDLITRLGSQNAATSDDGK